jgi:glycosyltransferase involved in cell wall biosynthesis
MRPFPVTVCIPVYNPGLFLEASIDSILAQNYTEFKLLVIDDNSVEPVKQIIGEYSDPRIEFHQNQENLGLVGNWNKCLKLAQGDYVTVFHQDDIMHPENLQQKIALFEANPDVGLVFSDIQRIDSQGRILGRHLSPHPQVNSILTGDQLFALIAASGNIISCPSVVMSRKCYQRLGLFDSRLQFAVDLEMWMRIATSYNVGYLANPLVYHRVHPDQETRRFHGTGQDYQDTLRALDIVKSYPLTRTQMGLMAEAYKTLSGQSLNMARWNFQHGQLFKSIRYFTVSLMAYQRSIQFQH